MPETLEYAAPRGTAAPWGPILVRPGRRSALLLILSLVATAWLALRHTPWVAATTVILPASGPRPATAIYMQNRYLLTHDTDLGRIDVWDADTGRAIRRFSMLSGPAPWQPIGHYVVEGGRYVFTRALDDRTAQLLDPLTGNVLARGTAPPGRILDASADAVLYAEESSVADGQANATTVGLWRPFDRAAKNPVHQFKLPAGATAQLSPDGRTVLATAPARPTPLRDARFAPSEVTYDLHLFDVESGRLVATIRDRDPQLPPAFSADGEVLVSVWTNAPQPMDVNGFRRSSDSLSLPDPAPAQQFERHSTRTGERLSTVTAPSNLTEMIPFGDGTAALVTARGIARNGPSALLTPSRFVRSGFAPGGTGAAPVRDATSVIDLREERSPVGRTFRNVIYAPRAAPFSDGRRMAIGIGATSGLGIFDPDPAQPLARLPNPPLAIAQLSVSPDGNRLAAAARDNAVRLYRRAGFECRESHLGVLGMPHAWLLVALVTALAFSLRADARRTPAESAVAPAIALIALAMLVIALPRTLQFVLTACTGHWLMTPAPAVLLCGVGLASGSRFWRFASLVGLACALPFYLYCAFVLRRAGMDTPFPLELIDRTFDLPRVPLFVTVVALAVLIVPAIVQLARRANP